MTTKRIRVWPATYMFPWRRSLGLAPLWAWWCEDCELGEMAVPYDNAADHADHHGRQHKRWANA